MIKTLLLRSFQSIHEMRITMQSKLLLSVLGMSFRADDHQSARQKMLLPRASCCQCRRSRTACQISLASEQPTRRCVIVSDSWQHRAQLSSVCRLCRRLLAEVQQRSWRTSHPKNLHLPGALVLLRIFAPGIEDCPMKKALYAEACLWKISGVILSFFCAVC